MMSIGADSGTWSMYRRQRDAWHLPIIKWALHTCPITHSHTAHLHFHPSFIYHFIPLSLPHSFSVSRLLESSLMCSSFRTLSGGVTIATTLSSRHQNHVFLQLSAPPHWPTHIVWVDFIIMFCAILVALITAEGSWKQYVSFDGFVLYWITVMCLFT